MIASPPLSIETSPAASWSWLHRRLAETSLADRILARRARDILRRTRLHDHLPPGSDCLEVGSGLAHLMEAVLASSPAQQVTGIDPGWSPASAVMRRLDRAASGRWRFLAADGADLPFPDGRFDVAWAAFVLHHVEYALQLRVLREISRVVRPGGTFLLLEDTPETAEEHARTERADRRLNLEARGERHFYRMPGGWRACLDHSGFALVHEEVITGIFPRATLKPVPHRLYVCRRMLTTAPATSPRRRVIAGPAR